MDNNSLYHHGILGMKWGRRRYQNKDGSLTPAGKKRYGDSDGQQKEETVEEKRARLLKSTNAEELYKNRSLLTTNEINERLNRIDTEARLGKVAASTKKTGMDRINKTLEIAKKVDDVYKFMNDSTIGKKLQEKIFGKPVLPEFDINKVYANRKKMSLQELRDAKSQQELIEEIEDLAGKGKNSQVLDFKNLNPKKINELTISEINKYGNAAKKIETMLKVKNKLNDGDDGDNDSDTEKDD